MEAFSARFSENFRLFLLSKISRADVENNPQGERKRLPTNDSQKKNGSGNYFTLYRAFRNVPILTIRPSFTMLAITRSTVVALISGSL